MHQVSERCCRLHCHLRLLCCLRSEHDALGDDDIAVYNTPEGMLAADVVPEGVYVPEVVVSKNVRKARGRMRVSAQQG